MQIIVKYPDWTRGTAKSVPDIALFDIAAEALAVWHNITASRRNNPAEPFARANEAGLRGIATEDSRRGHLIKLALDDALSCDVSHGHINGRVTRYQSAEWDVAGRLAALAAAERVPVVLEDDRSDRCSHGVLFSDPCGECGP